MAPLTTRAGVDSVPRRTGPACLVSIYGRDLGRRWMLDTPALVIGRDDGCDVQVDLDSVSRRHCEIVRGQAGGHLVRDLRSTNGTFVNGQEVRDARPLLSGDLLKVGGTLFKYIGGESLEQLFHEEIYRLTIIDGLTEAYNRRYLGEYLEREMSRSRRYGRALSLMMLDLDHFKRINDQFGHVAGDHVLREVAGLIRQQIRREECFARYGGEEFALAVPEAPRENLLAYAERLRSLVCAARLRFDGREIPVTVSIGVASLQDGMEKPEELVALADGRLYEAKSQGRNRVVG